MSVEVHVEPLDCPRCKESNIPVMSISCPHSHCLGCIQKLGLRQQQQQKEQDHRGQQWDENDRATAAGAGWVRCPVCNAPNAFRVNDTANHLNLKACELMETAATLHMALFSEREKHKLALQQSSCDHEKIIFKLQSEADQHRKESRDLREALELKAQVIFNLQEEIESLRVELWKAKGGEQRVLVSSQRKRKRNDGEPGILEVDVGDPSGLYTVQGPTNATSFHKIRGDETGKATGTHKFKDEAARADEKTAYGRFVAKVNGIQRLTNKQRSDAMDDSNTLEKTVLTNDPKSKKKAAGKQPVSEDDSATPAERDQQKEENPLNTEVTERKVSPRTVNESSAPAKAVGFDDVERENKVAGMHPEQVSTASGNTEETIKPSESEQIQKKKEQSSPNEAVTERELCSTILASMAVKTDGLVEAGTNKVTSLVPDQTRDLTGVVVAEGDHPDRKLRASECDTADPLTAKGALEAEATPFRSEEQPGQTERYPSRPIDSNVLKNPELDDASSMMEDSIRSADLKSKSSEREDPDENEEETDSEGCVRKPGRHDVILGRGGSANNHPGNVKFRQLVKEYKKQYLSAPKMEKPKVSKEVVRIWRELDPPGRFLARSDNGKTLEGRWFDVGDAKARVKASQCLRERTEDAIAILQEIKEEHDLDKRSHAKRPREVELQRGMVPELHLSGGVELPTNRLDGARLDHMTIARGLTVGETAVQGQSPLVGARWLHQPNPLLDGIGMPPSPPLQVVSRAAAATLAQDQVLRDDDEMTEVEYHRNMMLMHQQRMQMRMRLHAAQRLHVQRPQHEPGAPHEDAEAGRIGGSMPLGAGGTRSFRPARANVSSPVLQMGIPNASQPPKTTSPASYEDKRSCT